MPCNCTNKQNSGTKQVTKVKQIVKKPILLSSKPSANKGGSVFRRKPIR